MAEQRYKIQCCVCETWVESPGPHAPLNWGLFCRVDADGAARGYSLPFCPPCADSLWGEFHRG